MTDQAVDHLREVVGELKGKDTSAAASKEDGLFKPHGTDHSANIPRLLRGVEPFVGAGDELAGRHLASVKGHAGEFGREGGHDVVELPAVTISAGDEGYERAGALVPVVEVAAFVEDDCFGGIEFHGGSRYALVSSVESLLGCCKCFDVGTRWEYVAVVIDRQPLGLGYDGIVILFRYHTNTSVVAWQNLANDRRGDNRQGVT